MKKIKVIVKRPDSKPYTTWISNSLENLQRTVDGYIETVTLATDCVLIVNEEGRLLGLPYNCNICGLDIFGTVIVAGVDGDEFADCLDGAKELIFGQKEKAAPTAIGSDQL